METYDYIVVGGGTAGCVVAARLSRIEGVRVLLVEAGSRRMPLASKIPLLFNTLKQHPTADWAYQSEPEPGAGNRRFLRSHGKGLGGSSAINGMIAVRGHPADYDAWAELGLPGWSYSDVLPYFVRMESHWRGAAQGHGADGPWRIGPGNLGDPFLDVLRQTAGAYGRPLLDDLNGPDQEGIGAPDFSISGGMRVSMADAYLPQAGKGLRVLTDALVQRVLFEGRRAVGIELVRGGEVIRYGAGREVILSSGGYNSPKLLLLSGVGDAGELAQMGIASVHDLPGVGRNLQGHVSVPLRYRSTRREGFHEKIRFDRMALAALRWAFQRKGTLASVPLTALSYVRSRDGLNRPDIQIMYATGRMDDYPWFPLIRPGMGHFVSSSISLCRPQSRGSVTLRSPAPQDPPRILFNLLQHPADIVPLREAMRRERAFYATPPLADWLGEEELPGTDYQTDDELDARLRQTATSGQHPTSTCAMGNGPDAVTDAQLKVHGLAGLRVADASAIPLMVSGNTYVSAVLIGEKAADLIAADHARDARGA